MDVGSASFLALDSATPTGAWRDSTGGRDIDPAGREALKAYYCDHFALPPPAGHRFPMAKYAMLREAVLAERIVRAEDMHVPDPVTDEDIERAHDRDAVTQLM